MNYIDIFKKKIEEEVRKSNGDKAFIDSLFNSIKIGVIKTVSISTTKSPFTSPSPIPCILQCNSSRSP